MNEENLTSANPLIEKLIARKSRFVTIFREVRTRFVNIADYPILIQIAKLCGEHGRKLSKNEISNTLHYSQDYKTDENRKLYFKDIEETNEKYVALASKNLQFSSGKISV